MVRVRVVPALGELTPINLDVPENETIGTIKQKVCEFIRLSPGLARASSLVFKGKQLRDDQTLEDTGVEDLDKLILIIRPIA